jgi:hypothetical protein
MSVNVTMPDKTTNQVPSWDEFAALQARVARLEGGHVTLRNAVAERNARGPAADEVRTGTGVGLNTDTQTGLAVAPAQRDTATAAQVAAGAGQTPHATPPITQRPPPPAPPLR